MNEFMHKPIDGLPLTQNKYIENAFKLLNGIEIVIEIGTQYGGFALFLRKMFPDAEIHTVDISDWETENKRELFDENDINFHVKDAHHEVIQGEIISLINKGSALVLCDGGHKINEFTLYGKHLKSGDYIGAHDYGVDAETFKTKIEHKYWTESHEVRWDQLSGYCEENNLKRIYTKEFEKAVWLLCKKS
jgi:23S rRNA U2552 (ribose-2'-O)-methylase RlmE/FtsJ